MRKTTFNNSLKELVMEIPINNELLMGRIRSLQGSNYGWELLKKGSAGTLKTGGKNLGFYINISWDINKLVVDYYDRPRGYNGRDEFSFLQNKWN